MRELEFTEYLYLVEGLSVSQARELISHYDGKLSDLVRTGEAEYKASPVDLDDEDEVVALLVTSPRCLERPILDDGNRAVIGRPPEDIIPLLP
jgi:arsenate reductase